MQGRSPQGRLYRRAFADTFVVGTSPPPHQKSPFMLDVIEGLAGGLARDVVGTDGRIRPTKQWAKAENGAP
jgi:hypothetical protein